MGEANAEDRSRIIYTKCEPEYTERTSIVKSADYVR